jgi:hypothetical protein
VVVAEGVIDLLELVDVHDQQRDRVEGAGRRLQGVPQSLVQQRAVRQPREPVVQRLVAQDLGRHHPLGDVLQRDPDRATREREHVGREDRDGLVGGVQPQVVEHEALARASDRHERVADQLAFGHAIDDDQFVEGQADGIVGPPIEQVRPRGVDGEEPERGRVVEVGRAVDEEREVEPLDQVEVLVHLLLDDLAIGHVDHDPAHPTGFATSADLDAHAVVQVHDAAVGGDEPVPELGVGSGLHGTLIAGRDPVEIIGVHVVGPEAGSAPGECRVAEQLLRPPIDVERRGGVGELLPHHRVDAAHQVDVATPDLALDLGDATHDGDEEGGADEIDEQALPAAGRVPADDERGETERSHCRGLTGDASAEGHRRGGIDGERDEQDRCDEIGYEGKEADGQHLVAEGERGAERTTAPHRDVVDRVVRHEDAHQGRGDPAPVGLGERHERDHGDGDQCRVSGPQGHPPELELPIAPLEQRAVARSCREPAPVEFDCSAAHAQSIPLGASSYGSLPGRPCP